MKTNWLAIVACVVAGMVLGFLWYGYFFNAQWMSGNGITMDETNTKMFKNGVEVAMSQTPMIANTLAMVVYAIILNWLIQKTNSISLNGGATIGAVIGLTHVLGIFIANLFAQNSMTLSLVDGSYALVIFTVFGAILGGWVKK